MVVTQRKQISKKLEAFGYNSNNCMIVGQETGFVNAELFDYWATTVFFPEVECKRILYNYTGDVILMLDGCTAHFSDFMLDECSYNGVFPFQEPAGSSDQLQALDLGIFAIQKTAKRTILTPRGVDGEAEKDIIRIIDSWRKTTTPKNVISAFNQAEIYRTNVNGKIIMAADIKCARGVRGIPHEDPPICETYSSFEKIRTF